MAYVKGQPFYPQFTDPATGLLMTSGTVELYLTGTSTPTPYYTDSIGTSGGTSLTLNSGGKPTTDVYYDTTITYKLIVKNAAGSELETIDPFAVSDTALVTAASYPKILTTVAAMQAATLPGVVAIQTLGYTAAGDGGAGLYRADTGDTSTADDGFLCIVSNDGVRFKLVLDGDINMLQAGVHKDNTESSARQQVVMDYCKEINASPVYPDGLYKIGTTVNINSPGDNNPGYRRLEVKCGHEAKFSGTSNAVTLFNIEGQKLFKWSGGWFTMGDVCFQGANGASPRPPDAYCHFNNIIFEGDSTGAINKCYSSTSPIGSYWTDCDFGTDARSDSIGIAVDMTGNDIGQSNLAKFTRCVFKGMTTGGVNMPNSTYARFGTSFTDCRFETIGGYALTIGTNSRDVVLNNCYWEGCGSVSVSPIVMTGGKLVINGGQIAGSQTNQVAFIDANGASIEIETRGKIEYLATTPTTVFVKYADGISQPQYLKGVNIQGSGTETYKSLLFSTATQAQEQYIEWEMPRTSSTLIDTQINKKILGNHSHKGFISYETEIVNLIIGNVDYDLCNINIPKNLDGIRFSVESYQTVQGVGHAGQFNEWLAHYNGSAWTFTAVGSATTVAGFTFTPVHIDANNFKVQAMRTAGVTQDSGTTDGTSANKLIQSGQDFLTTVAINDVVVNTTDSTTAIVTAVDSDTQLSLDTDIMVSGESFKIFDPVTGNTPFRAMITIRQAAYQMEGSEIVVTS